MAALALIGAAVVAALIYIGAVRTYYYLINKQQGKK